jgi:hypothetical protein
VFKHFFDDKEIFKSLVDFYNPDSYRFEMKNAGARNKVMKFLDMKAGFEVCLIENPADFMFKISSIIFQDLTNISARPASTRAGLINYVEGTEIHHILPHHARNKKITM